MLNYIFIWEWQHCWKYGFTFDIWISFQGCIVGEYCFIFSFQPISGTSLKSYPLIIYMFNKFRSIPLVKWCSRKTLDFVIISFRFIAYFWYHAFKAHSPHAAFFIGQRLLSLSRHASRCTLSCFLPPLINILGHAIDWQFYYIYIFIMFISLTYMFLWFSLFSDYYSPRFIISYIPQFLILFHFIYLSSFLISGHVFIDEQDIYFLKWWGSSMYRFEYSRYILLNFSTLLLLSYRFW